jgi:hypothetical protein
MARLNDLQLILLSSAAAREDGSLLPPPDSVGDRSPAIDKAIKSLLRRKLAEEMEVTINALAWRQDGDLLFGVAITDAGRAAIGVSDDTAEADEDAAPSPDADTVPTEPAREQTKAALVLEMLQRPEGATLDALVEATGWLPHTTRAALTGLRKKGHTVTSEKVDGIRHYRIATEA